MPSSLQESILPVLPAVSTGAADDHLELNPGSNPRTLQKADTHVMVDSKQLVQDGAGLCNKKTVKASRAHRDKGVGPSRSQVPLSTDHSWQD